MRFAVILVVFSGLFGGQQVMANEPPPSERVATIPVWSDSMPAWEPPTKPESDTSTADSRTVAGRPVIRLGNVSKPELHIYPAQGDAIADTTVVIAPGGGYSILAWDLEGTEVAEWLNSIGVHAVVLKYRVPTRSAEQKWLAPVQDFQRAVSMVRSGKVPGVGTKHVGVLGFSAGGNAATRTLTLPKRVYAETDAIDRTSCKPDFGVLVYPAWLAKMDPDNPKKSTLELIDDIEVNSETPPMFLAHAYDDRISCLGPVAMFAALKNNDVNACLSVFGSGGHGFGLRKAGSETDNWPRQCAAWLRQIGVAN